MSVFDINDLRQKRAAVNDKVQALAALEGKGESLSTEQLQEFSSLQAEFKDLTAKIERAEQAEQMLAQTAKPLDSLGKSNSAGWSAEPKRPEVKGAKVARMIMALGATGGRSNREAAHYAEQTLHDADVAAALNTTTASAGGVLVPQNFFGEVIELLRPNSVMRNMGAVVVPLPNGNLTQPKMTGGAMAYYTSEGSDIQVSEQTFGDLKLSAKDLTGLVPVSNQVLNYNGLHGGFEKLIIDDLVFAVGNREDQAYIRGDGTNNTPKGLRYQAPASNVIVAGAGTSAALIDADLNKLDLKLMEANVRMRKAGYLMSPRTYLYLNSMRDGNGNKIYPSLEAMELRKRPVAVTTNIPANLGTGTESELYLVDFADALIGEVENVSIAISTEAAYKDPATGQLVSAFSRNQTLIRVVFAADFGMRHDASVAVLSGVKWGS